MSNITYEDLLNGLRHEDLFVRSSSLIYLCESGVPCQTDATHLVLDALDEYGWEDAVTSREFLEDLPLDKQSGERLLTSLRKMNAAHDVHMVLKWFANSQSESVLSLLPDIEEAAGEWVDSEFLLEVLRFQSSIANFSIDQCQSQLAEMTSPEAFEDFDYFDDDFRFRALIARLGKLGGIETDDVMSRIEREAPFKDEFEMTADELDICIGFEMAKVAGVPIPVERCLGRLGAEYEWLSDSIVEIIVAMNDNAMVENLANSYKDLDIGVRHDLATIFCRVPFSGGEDKMRDLASLEQDAELRARLALAACYYGTDKGLKYARETIELMPEDFEATDIIDVVYGIRVLKGESAPELDEWRGMLAEIHNMTLSMDPEEFVLPGPAFDLVVYDPMVAPDPEVWREMDEDDKMAIVREFCKGYENGIEGFDSHVALHVVVEDQIAEDRADLPARETVERLIKEGANRHEAIHALAHVVGGLMHSVATGKEDYSVEKHAKAITRLKSSEWKGAAPGGGQTRQPSSYLSSGESFQGESPKARRNDPCPCGSGKKYKKCCIKNAN